MKKKETTVLFGQPGEATVEASKKKLEAAGRKVEIRTGLCDDPKCACTVLCKSFHYKPFAG